MKPEGVTCSERFPPVLSTIAPAGLPEHSQCVVEGGPETVRRRSESLAVGPSGMSVGRSVELHVRADVRCEGTGETESSSDRTGEHPMEQPAVAME